VALSSSSRAQPALEVDAEWFDGMSSFARAAIVHKKWVRTTASNSIATAAVGAGLAALGSSSRLSEWDEPVHAPSGRSRCAVGPVVWSGTGTCGGELASCASMALVFGAP